MSLPPTSFVGVSTFSDSFQTVLERTFNAASLPVTNLQTEQTILQSRQVELGNLEGDLNKLRDVFNTLGVSGAQGTVKVTSSNTSVASVTRVGTPEPVDFDIEVTSAADKARETTAVGLTDVDATALSSDGVYSLTLGSSSETYNLLTVGSGRTAGTNGSATPSPKVSVDVAFSGGLSGSISAELDSFFVASSAPSTVGAGDQVTVSFASVDGGTNETITTDGLNALDDADAIATALNDKIALNANLNGKVSFSAVGGKLELTVSDSAGTGFNFTSSSTGTTVTGLESGGTAGGHSAAEIAAALNASVQASSTLKAAGVRFSAYGGEVRVEGDTAFDITVTDNDQGTGFASGLAGVHSVAGFDNTLAGLRDAINAGNLDVTATLVNFSDNPAVGDYRILLSSNKTGSTTLTLKDSSNGDLITTSNQGVDAVFTVNGVQITNSGNTISDFAPGLSLTIVGAGSTRVAASNDQSGTSSNLSDLAAAYNTVLARIGQHIGKDAGVLSGDVLVREAQATLRAIAGYTGSGSIHSIAELGLELNEDGLMTFNAIKFASTAASDFNGVKDFLGTTTTGFIGASRSRVADLSDPVNGAIQTAIDFIQESDASLSKQITALQERIDQRIAALEAQFAAADTLLAGLESQKDLLTQLFKPQSSSSN
ncbi:MAG: flagellar filament capping protein FliD [Acidobacteria bacterium]|nr:flagellar filament capping protein FliD [Acidobacteriota bacterium]